MERALSVRSGFWEMIDARCDPSVIQQLHPVSCGPACGAMLLRSQGVVDGLDSAGRVVIRDPALGTRYLMLWDEFTHVWEGQTI
jgi:predicted double-glycine peptidase